jgi:hypothetical protein
MATIYEVLNGLPAEYAKGGAFEETAFKQITADADLTTDDQRITLVDPTAGPVTVTLPEFAYDGYSQDVRNVTALTTAITINSNSVNIDGNPTVAFAKAYGRIKVQYVPATGAAAAQYLILENK